MVHHMPLLQAARSPHTAMIHNQVDLAPNVQATRTCSRVFISRKYQFWSLSTMNSTVPVLL